MKFKVGDKIKLKLYSKEEYNKCRDKVIKHIACWEYKYFVKHYLKRKNLCNRKLL